MVLFWCVEKKIKQQKLIICYIWGVWRWRWAAYVTKYKTFKTINNKKESGRKKNIQHHFMEITYQINHFNLKFSFDFFSLGWRFNYWLEFYLNWIDCVCPFSFPFSQLNTFEFVNQNHVWKETFSFYHNSWYRHYSSIDRWLIYQHTICFNFFYLHNFKRCFDYWDLSTFWFHIIFCLYLIDFFQLVVNWWWIRFRAFLFQKMMLKCVWRAKIFAVFNRYSMRPAECTQQRFLCATYSYGISKFHHPVSVQRTLFCARTKTKYLRSSQLKIVFVSKCNPSDKYIFLLE